MNPYKEKPDASDAAKQQLIADSIRAQLLRLNSEFTNYVPAEYQLPRVRLDLLRGDHLFSVMARPSRIGTMVETSPSVPKISRVYSRRPEVAASSRER